MATSNDDDRYKIEIDYVVPNREDCIESLYKMFDGDDNTYAYFSKYSSNYPTITLTLKKSKFKISKFYVDFLSTEGAYLSSFKYLFKVNGEWIEINDDNSQIGYKKTSGYSSQIEIQLNESLIINGFIFKPAFGRNEINTYKVRNIYFEGYEIPE